MIQTYANAKIISLLLIAKWPKKKGIKKRNKDATLAIDLLNKILFILYRPTIIINPKKAFIIWKTSNIYFFGKIWLMKLDKDQYKVENLYLYKKGSFIKPKERR